MAWLRTYDITTPDGSVDSPAEAADRMNEIKLATQEREDTDHYWPLTGTEVSDLDAGEHRKITLRSLTAVAVAALAAAKAYIYHLVTDGELYFKDAAGNTIQLTSGGKILSASLNMLDEDNMISDSAVHTLTQQSSKAYADAIAAAATVEIAAVAGHDGDGYAYYDIDGVKTKVYTKYLTGNLGAGAATNVAHGVVGIDKILDMGLTVYNSTFLTYRIIEIYLAAAASESLSVRYDGTNVLISAVGTQYRGQKYRIKIDYIL